MLDALSNLHRPAQALIEAHVKHTSTLYDFATQQHILVSFFRYTELAEFSLVAFGDSSTMQPPSSGIAVASTLSLC